MPCFPSLSDLPEPPDAVVVAIPAAGRGRGGGGGRRDRLRRRRGLRRRLRRDRPGRGARARAGGGRAPPRPAASAARTATGSWPLHERVALWGDALRPLEPGRVALVSQSGNVAVNALATRRGLRLHTVISCGNSAALDPADWIAAARARGGRGLDRRLPGGRRRRRPALRGARRMRGRAAWGCPCSRSASSPAGALAAAAHTGAVAGDQRVFRALVEEAGAAWAEDVHELLELAKAQAVPGRSPAEPAARRPGGAHLLGRRLRPRRRLLRPQRARPSAARAGHRRRGSASCCPTPPRSATRSTTPP